MKSLSLSLFGLYQFIDASSKEKFQPTQMFPVLVFLDLKLPYPKQTPNPKNTYFKVQKRVVWDILDF